MITDDVVQLRKSIDAPGMAVLQFGIQSIFTLSLLVLIVNVNGSKIHNVLLVPV